MISHNEQGLRGSIADRYVDHKRSELLSTIVDLELVSHDVMIEQEIRTSTCLVVEQYVPMWNALFCAIVANIYLILFVVVVNGSYEEFSYKSACINGKGCLYKKITTQKFVTQIS